METLKKMFCYRITYKSYFFFYYCQRLPCVAKFATIFCAVSSLSHKRFKFNYIIITVYKYGVYICRVYSKSNKKLLALFYTKTNQNKQTTHIISIHINHFMVNQPCDDSDNLTVVCFNLYSPASCLPERKVVIAVIKVHGIFF